MTLDQWMAWTQRTQRQSKRGDSTLPRGRGTASTPPPRRGERASAAAAAAAAASGGVREVVRRWRPPTPCVSHGAVPPSDAHAVRRWHFTAS